MRRFIGMVHEDRRLGILLVVLVASASGLFSAWLTPRGPVSSGEALVTMGATLIVGIVAGLLMGSRWSTLLAPIAYLIAFEIGRLSVQGPTVDAIMLDNVYGIIAFITGRLAHWILAAGPMAVGSVLGVWIATHLSPQTSVRIGIVGWLITGLLAVGFATLAVVIARPARTYPITGPEQGAFPESIAELITVEVGGQEQTLMVRGRDINNPVLLYLAGGPGGTDLGAMRGDVSLEQYFVVVTWDQRGAGKSYAAIDPIEDMTLKQMLSDTIEITNYLRDRFDEQKIYLVGNSWGTILGVLAAQRNPDLYHAYVGTGQMVSPRETDIMFYEDTLAWAGETEQTDLVGVLEQNGPPPYQDLLDYEPVINHEHDWNPYPELDPGKEIPFNTFVPENTFMDRINAMRGLLDTFAVLYPQLQGIDFRDDVPELEIPVYMVTGAHEARGRRVLAQEWFEALSAPSKESVTFEHSGHRPPFEQPADFAAFMQRVLDETYKD